MDVYCGSSKFVLNLNKDIELHTLQLQLALRQLYQHGNKVLGITYYSILEGQKSMYFTEILGSHGRMRSTILPRYYDHKNICCCNWLGKLDKNYPF